MQEKLYPRRWAILACFVLLIFTAQFSALLPAGSAVLIMTGYGFTPMQLSMVSTIPFLAGAALSIVSGVLADRIGVNKVVVATCAVAIVGAVWRCFAGGDFVQLLLSSLLTGVVFGSLGAVSAKILRMWFPGKSNSLAMGAYASAASMGVCLSILFGTHVGNLDVEWRFTAGLFVVVSVLWLVMYRNHPDGEALATDSIGRHLGSVLKKRSVWGISFFAFLVLGAMNVNGAYMVAGLTTLAGDPGVVQEVGVLSSLNMVVQSIAGVVLPVVFTARFKRMRAPIAIGCIGAGVCYAVMYFLPYGMATWALYLVCPIFIGFLVPISATLPVLLNDVAPEHLGAVGGVQITFQNIGMCVIASYILAPIATAVDPSGGVGFYQAIYVGLAVVFVVAILEMFVFPNVRSNVGAKIADDMAAAAVQGGPDRCDGEA